MDSSPVKLRTELEKHEWAKRRTKKTHKDTDNFLLHGMKTRAPT
jgi:hypothetical protein